MKKYAPKAIAAVCVLALAGFAFSPSEAQAGGPHGYHHGGGHYDYHPGYVVPHGNHYDYVPGHYHYHNGPHYNYSNRYSSRYGSRYGSGFSYSRPGFSISIGSPYRSYSRYRW
ncbi:Hypothetical protein PBC10988_29910 [Planctomycetales bacterium 10988]|nr:Hypothetical protein PBC10988_29910 [Planctomycetales bacterium 10988]